MSDNIRYFLREGLAESLGVTIAEGEEVVLVSSDYSSEIVKLGGWKGISWGYIDEDKYENILAEIKAWTNITDFQRQVMVDFMGKMKKRVVKYRNLEIKIDSIATSLGFSVDLVDTGYFEDLIDIPSDQFSEFFRDLARNLNKKNAELQANGSLPVDDPLYSATTQSLDLLTSFSLAPPGQVMDLPDYVTPEYHSYVFHGEKFKQTDEGNPYILSIFIPKRGTVIDQAGVLGLLTMCSSYGVRNQVESRYIGDTIILYKDDWLETLDRHLNYLSDITVNDQIAIKDVYEHWFRSV